MTQYLGLGKTKFNSSVCLIDEDGSVELLLTERLNRKKNSGHWPEAGLKKLLPRLKKENLKMAENRDVRHPKVIEDFQNEQFLFYDYLKQNGLDLFASHFNSEIEHIPHHLCHAYAALALSPFDQSVIVVMDGAGSELAPNEYEECTVYLQNGVHLEEVYKQTTSFFKSQKRVPHTFGNRIGGTYEKAAEFIFNSPHSSGKVMGLAPFGEASAVGDYLEFQENLPWEKAFKVKGKAEWEGCDHSLFKNIAASVQQKLEEDYDSILAIVRKKFPDYENLILAGGCALNCTNNARLYYQNQFKKIYIPPFPGDESISFGIAHYLKYKDNPSFWKKVSREEQAAYFGSKMESGFDAEVEREFSMEGFDVKKSVDIFTDATSLLENNQIIAWFQGRSESGPRALGNRSILARPDVAGLKDHLNKNIKFRESFRPYGCSVLHGKAHQYFEVDEGFDNPFMSFAIKVKDEYKDKLKEVSHIDQTSRMQTVRVGQNEKFYRLIEAFGNKTGLYCLLNTSLNVMDEPILETVSDAKRFMEKSPIQYLVIGNYIVSKK